MDTKSLWVDITSPKKSYQKLDRKLDVDVLIVGGGITGITTALELLDSGKSIAIVEANKIGRGTTGFSTGNLYVLIQSYYQNLSSNTNDPLIKAIIKARTSAIDYIESNVKKHKIVCNYKRRPSYLYTNDDKKIQLIEKEAGIIANAGVEVEYPAELDTGLAYKRAVKIPNQAKMNPYAYVDTLAEFLNKSGVAIFENSPVENIDTGKICKVYTDQGEIHAKMVVMATHIPKGIHITPLLAPAYRSYVVAVRLNDPKTFNSGHYWGVAPHYVLSTHSSNPESDVDDLMVCAGSHHRTGTGSNNLKHYIELENYLREHYNVNSLAYKWSAQHYQSADGVPYIGPISSHHKNVFIASGYFADGLVFGTVAGQILGKLLSGKQDAWSKYVEPHRLAKFSSIKTLTSEMLFTYIEYAKDFPANSDKNTMNELTQGEAKIVDIKGEKCGIYKDKAGKVHCVSVVCTHMKCILNWNNSETTWDCPCHGSRFTHDGVVIEGPAYVNLKKIDWPASSTE